MPPQGPAYNGLRGDFRYIRTYGVPWGAYITESLDVPRYHPRLPPPGAANHKAPSRTGGGGGGGAERGGQGPGQSGGDQ